MVRVFALMLDAEDEQIEERIEQHFPADDYLKLSPMSYLLYTDKTAADVTGSLGIGSTGSNEETGGVVFSLNGSYSGFFRNQLWKWVDRKRDQARDA